MKTTSIKLSKCLASLPTYLRIEPLGLAFNGHEKVVEVHDAVHSVVHGSKEQPGGSLGSKGVPAAEQNRNMMIPMQEHEFLLVNDNEESISKFRDFAQDEEHAPETRGGGPNHVFRIETELSPHSVVVQVVQ
jgi:hypothetical protein